MCGGIASSTFISTPPLSPNLDHARRAKISARSACDPDTRTASSDRGLTLTNHPRGLDAHAEAPEAARSDARRIEHSEVQPRRRGDHDRGHVRSAT